MLEKVKSSYIIKMFFSYIYERKKLKLIKYNRKIQKKVDVDINNYKLFKRKYVTFDKNGFAKEYGLFDNRLIYEGEYLNGERNGRGKEYNDIASVSFEGEFKKGKKWNNLNLKNGKGYIKEYKNNVLIYEGEYLNGERNGKGKEYNDNGKLIFEGEYVNGIKYNGWGYDEDNGNKIYELKFGKGCIKEYKNNILIYEGKYLEGKRNGEGKEYDNSGEIIFEGEYLYGFKHKGKEYNNKKLIFEGEY